jgi:hypothetical protein
VDGDVMNQIAISEADRAELIGLEEAMWIDGTRYDKAFQERHFAPDFFEFGRSGRTYTREQIMQFGGDHIAAILPLPNLAIRVLDVSTVQITYNSVVTYDGVAFHSRRSSVWSRFEGRWVMRFHQGTPFEPGM